MNNAPNFVGTTSDDGDEFIVADVNKDTSFVECNYRDEIVMDLHFVIDNYLKTSLVQQRY